MKILENSPVVPLYMIPLKDAVPDLMSTFHQGFYDMLGSIAYSLYSRWGVVVFIALENKGDLLLFFLGQIFGIVNVF